MFIRGGPSGPIRPVIMIARVEGLEVVGVLKGRRFIVVESGGLIVDVWLSHDESRKASPIRGMISTVGS